MLLWFNIPISWHAEHTPKFSEVREHFFCCRIARANSCIFPITYMLSIERLLFHRSWTLVTLFRLCKCITHKCGNILQNLPHVGVSRCIRQSTPFDFAVIQTGCDENCVVLVFGPAVWILSSNTIIQHASTVSKSTKRTIHAIAQLNEMHMQRKETKCCFVSRRRYFFLTYLSRISRTMNHGHDPTIQRLGKLLRSDNCKFIDFLLQCGPL